MKIALVAGATGLIGSQLLDVLLNDSRYEKVIAISRKPLQNRSPKLHNVLADLSTLATHKDQLQADDIFCCLGTTMGQAKSREAFRKVDFDYPLALARIGLELGAHQYLMVSALGANKDSSIFYSRVKGETEDALTHVGFESLHILRPSLLVGPRVETRTGEGIAIKVYSAFDFLIPRKFKAIQSIKVARALLAFATLEQNGIFIHDSRELQLF
jgi:uncharacterized protein YbjT (DUF2867 family)